MRHAGWLLLIVMSATVLAGDIAAVTRWLDHPLPLGASVVAGVALVAGNVLAAVVVVLSVLEE